MAVEHRRPEPLGTDAAATARRTRSCEQKNEGLAPSLGVSPSLGVVSLTVVTRTRSSASVNFVTTHTVTATKESMTRSIRRDLGRDTPRAAVSHA